MGAQKQTVLILAASPTGVKDPEHNNEISAITEIFDNKSDEIEYQLRVFSGITIEGIISKLDKYRPSVIHFIGHSNHNGICVEQENRQAKLLDNDDLVRIFNYHAKDTDCVVLNTCNSNTQAEVIKKFIPAIIFTTEKLPNNSAKKYSVVFYSTILGHPYKNISKILSDAHKLASSACEIQNLYGLHQYVNKPTGMTDKKDNISANNMLHIQLELLRQARLTYWGVASSQNIMKNLFIYSYDDSHFEASIRTLSERIGGDSYAFSKDKEYLYLLLDKVKDRPVEQHIHYLLGTLDFK